MWFIFIATCLFAFMFLLLLPTSPHDDAVEGRFGGEQLNSTGRIFTRVDASFAGAPRIKS